MRASLILLFCLLGAGCAHSPSYDPQDPLEPVNRGVFKFNDKLDQYVAQPVARGYVAAVPAELRVGVHNFLGNLGYPTVIVNDVLQGKFRQAGRDTTRLLLNTTFGLAGFFDPATMVGLERNDEDFGQTLGRWGVGQGWYLVVPFLGPSTNRELVGRGGDYLTSVTTHAGNDQADLVVSGGRLVDKRAQLLGGENLLRQQFDPYVFMRGLYLQQRLNLVFDGNAPREDFMEEDEVD